MTVYRRSEIFSVLNISPVNFHVVYFRRYDYVAKIGIGQTFIYVCKYNCNYTVHVYLFVEGNI